MLPKYVRKDRMQGGNFKIPSMHKALHNELAWGILAVDFFRIEIDPVASF